MEVACAGTWPLRAPVRQKWLSSYGLSLPPSKPSAGDALRDHTGHLRDLIQQGMPVAMKMPGKCM